MNFDVSETMENACNYVITQENNIFVSDSLKNHLQEINCEYLTIHSINTHIITVTVLRIYEQRINNRQYFLG